MRAVLKTLGEKISEVSEEEAADIIYKDTGIRPE